MIVYSPRYEVHLGKHVFPADKYRRVYEELTGREKVSLSFFLEPEPISDSDALLVHTYSYLDDLARGERTDRIHRSEIPLSREILEGVRLGVGGTLLAAREALRTGWAINLGGGFHHAFPDHAEGFCYLNDVAIAIRVLLEERRIERAFICDLDVHQGNGTAWIFKDDPRVFTFSMHQDKLYPQKQVSDLDVPLDRGVKDEEYLALLEKHLPAALEAHRPDLLFYLAGADPFEHDRLGSLGLTRQGLRKRDRLVISEARKRKIPLAAVLAGGYAEDVNDTVAIHVHTVLELLGWENR